MSVDKTYDKIAGDYDRMYEREICYKENDAVRDSLIKHGFSLQSVLDIGCGTGLLLDIMKVGDGYIGIDISQGMLDAFEEKHSGRDIVKVSFEEFIDIKGLHLVDEVVCLFGGISYVSPEVVRSAFEGFGGKAFLMFVRDGYKPPYSENDAMCTAGDCGFDVKDSIGDYEVVIL